MDLPLAFLAYSEATFLDATQSRSRIAKFMGFTVEITNYERTVRRNLDFIYLIRALLDGNAIVSAYSSLQFRNTRLKHSLKAVQFLISRISLHASLLAIY